MAEHTFDSVAFRKQFPVFASTDKYPDEQLSGYFTMATAYIYNYDWCGITPAQLQLALDLMTAHLTWTNQLLLKGNTATGIATGAGIDKINVSLQAPPITNGWQHWLATTPYGLQLWALLRAVSRGGFVVGGLPERDAFRNVYGVRGGGRRWPR